MKQNDPNLLARLREMIEVDLLPHHEAARRLNIGRTTIARMVRRYGLKTQRTGPRSGEKHPDWKGGRTIDRHGYVLAYYPNHPRARMGRYVFEHRLVMEKHLGRYLTHTEVVHHKNGVKADNRLENLELFDTNAKHLKHELTGRVPKWTAEGKRRIAAGVSKRRRRKA